VFGVPACADPRGATSPFRHTIQFSRTEPRARHGSSRATPSPSYPRSFGCPTGPPSRLARAGILEPLLHPVNDFFESLCFFALPSPPRGGPHQPFITSTERQLWSLGLQDRELFQLRRLLGGNHATGPRNHAHARLRCLATRKAQDRGPDHRNSRASRCVRGPRNLARAEPMSTQKNLDRHTPASCSLCLSAGRFSPLCHGCPLPRGLPVNPQRFGL
jgi:hypothetical protein